MAIDKELFYASHGLKYPVVARQYTDDMVVKEKLFTKEEVVAMLTEIQLEIEEVKTQSGFDEAWNGAVKQCSEIIQQRINELKGEQLTL